MKQWCATILLLLALLPKAPQAQPMEPHSAAISADSVPQPALDSSRIALLPAAPSAGPLGALPVAITPAPPFSSGSSAMFILAQDARSVFGRLALTPAPPSKAEPLRLLLHGQTAESIALEPGDYILRAWFWRPGSAKPLEYPQASEISLQPGQAATLTVTRAQYSAIKAWLRRAEENAKNQDPLKTHQQQGETNHESSHPRSKQ